MNRADFNYFLPKELIAQTPAAIRDQSRLLAFNRNTGAVSHHFFHQIPTLLHSGDILVLNNSRVIPARLHAVKEQTGGLIEIFLLKANHINDWWALTRPAKRIRIGSRVQITTSKGTKTDIYAVVIDKLANGECRFQFTGIDDITSILDQIGEIPLPPYIDRTHNEVNFEDKERYQTVYASTPGSVAAPTAGLHFTQQLLKSLVTIGIEIHYVTLHVGVGTFAPVKTDNIEEHFMHEEHFEIDTTTAYALNHAKKEGRRIIAVGTTTTRVLESVAQQNQGMLQSGSGVTKIFIYPPYQFKIVDALITNFHLPESTLLMLVSAFATPSKMAGRSQILSIYAEAINKKYRFFSYGDAMFIY